MLPVVRGERETVRQILAYTLVLIAVTLVPVRSGCSARVYLVAAVVLGARVPLARLAAPARARPGARGRVLPLLPRLPRAPLRRDGRRPPDRVTSDPETARKSLAIGWGLFALFLLLFGGSFAVALLYLALD